MKKERRIEIYRWRIKEENEEKDDRENYESNFNFDCF